MHPEDWNWTSDTELLAHISEQLDYLSALTFRANFSGKPPKFVPVPRPYDQKPKPKTTGPKKPSSKSHVVSFFKGSVKPKDSP